MRLLAEIRERVAALLFRARQDRELAEEMRFHVEQEMEKNMRLGMSAGEARRHARIAFGGEDRFVDDVRDARGVRPLQDIGREMHHAVRRLVREGSFSAPAVVTLALGIGVTVAVLALVNAVLLRPLPYPDAGRLVEVGHEVTRGETAGTGLSVGTFEHYRAGARVFDAIALYVMKVYALTDGDVPEQVRVANVSADFFDVLRIRPHLGRLPGRASAGESGGVVISHDLWVRRYGSDPAIIGRTIEIERRPEEVLAVAEPGFYFPDSEAQIWSIWTWPPLHGRSAALRSLHYQGIARLKPDVTPEAAGRDLERLLRQLPSAFADATPAGLEDLGLRTRVEPLKDIVVGDVRTALLLLLAMGCFLLLITWANVANLTLVRAERLRREVAVARALGASDGRLVMRFFAEGGLLAACGGALGLAVAWAAVELRFGFQPQQIPRLRELDAGGVIIGAAAALSLVSAVVLGLLAFISTRRADATRALIGTGGRTTTDRSGQRGRRLLVSAQVALALTLLIGSSLMARSYHELRQAEIGFEPAGALTFSLPIPPNYYSNYQAAAQLHDEVLTRLRGLPGVDAAEAGNQATFPLTTVASYYTARIRNAEGSEQADNWAHGQFSFATPGYFDAMRIPLLRGRPFRAADMNAESPGVILSASLARALFGDDDAIGRRVRWAAASSDPDYTVVAIVGDVVGASIQSGHGRAMYFPNVFPPLAETVTGRITDYIPSHEIYVVRTSLPPLSLVPAIRRSIDEVDAKLVMTRVMTLDELVDGSMAGTRLTMLLLLIGAGSALFLGMVGIYGVLAFAVRQRTPELGVRLALGATPAQVTRMVVGQAAALIAVGTAAGLAAAFALTRFMRSLLYEVRPDDPLTFGTAAAVLILIGLAASYMPARRAGRIDPARTLKAE